jgi:5-methylcytosine-specific restriction endonuclease McrA
MANKMLLQRHLRRLFYRQGELCFYCEQETWHRGSESKDRAAWRLFGIKAGTPGIKKRLTDRMATVEHLVRIVDGGSSKVENLRMACHGCNSGRGAIPVEEWKRQRAPQKKKKESA